VPRTNPYLVQHVGWKNDRGRLTTKVQCRIDGDALSAKTDLRLSRLSLVRASASDEAQNRVGLASGPAHGATQGSPWGHQPVLPGERSSQRSSLRFPRYRVERDPDGRRFTPSPCL
jgi:hypothetical protein